MQIVMKREKIASGKAPKGFLAKIFSDARTEAEKLFDEGRDVITLLCGSDILCRFVQHGVDARESVTPFGETAGISVTDLYYPVDHKTNNIVLHVSFTKRDIEKFIRDVPEASMRRDLRTAAREWLIKNGHSYLRL